MPRNTIVKTAPVTTKIKALTPIHDGDELHAPGAVIELVMAQAEELIRCGAAESVPVIDEAAAA